MLSRACQKYDKQYISEFFFISFQVHVGKNIFLEKCIRYAAYLFKNFHSLIFRKCNVCCFTTILIILLKINFNVYVYVFLKYIFKCLLIIGIDLKYSIKLFQFPWHVYESYV